MLSKRPTVSFVCFWMCALACCAYAQVSSATGAIQGTVTDPRGAVVPNATATLTNAALGLTRRTTTQSDGAYSFPLVQPAGGYQVTVEAPGFQRKVFTEIVARVTETAVVNIQLSVGSTAEEVVIRGEDAQPVQTTNPTLGGTLGPEVIAALPLNTRNPLQLLATDAGVASTPGSTTLFVAGNRSTFNNFVLNGVDANNFEFGSLSSVPTPTPDSVREFRTQTSLYDATQGRGSGANITLVTRSGSSKIHGNVYEFHRDSALAANDFFLNKNGRKKPFLLRNQFGASTGGPFPREKSFWFLNYEGSRQRTVSSITGFLPVLPANRDAASLAAAFNLPADKIDP
ncbi:MAG: carboxypeptidase regulatory-like domain-containing protein, partial [Blastocatellia bacterium]